MTGSRIDLHWFRSDQISGDTDAHLSLLDEQEVAQFQTFERDDVAANFALRRCVRRAVLARYFPDAGPSELGFETNSAGKPRLQAPHQRLFFNASHGHAGGVVAVCADFPIGVDVEFERALDHAAFAEKILSAEERRHYLEPPAEKRLTVLRTAWTAKEALVKALGIGLNLNLLPQMSVQSCQSMQGWRSARLSNTLSTEEHWKVWTGSLDNAFSQPAMVSIAAPQACEVVVQEAGRG